MKLSTVLAALALLAAAPASAEVTAAQRSACTPDAWRLCASEIPNVAGITACLRREKASLSAGCRTVMESADSPARSAATTMLVRN